MDSAPSAISPPTTPSTGPTWRSLRELIQSRGIHGKVIVSAELGLNHNGDPSLAKRMIEAAAEVGCHAVKVQNYRTGDVVKSRSESIEVNGVFWVAWDLFARCELSLETLGELKEHAERCGLVFHSTPTNEQGLRDLRAIGVRIVKLASDVVTGPVRHAADRMFQNVIASDGCTSDPGICGINSHWLWLHCVREYPARQADLEGVDRLRCAGIKLVGYSDHTEGIEAAVAAVKSHQAVWVECHTTLDHAMYGPDHRWSKDFTQMAELIRCLRA